MLGHLVQGSVLRPVAEGEDDAVVVSVGHYWTKRTVTVEATEAFPDRDLIRTSFGSAVASLVARVLGHQTRAWNRDNLSSSGRGLLLQLDQSGLTSGTG